MHKDEGLTAEELFQFACAECGLNGRAYTEEEENRVINKIGEITCVVKWVNTARILDLAKVFPYQRVREVLEPKMPEKIVECLHNKCPTILPLALGFLAFMENRETTR